MPASSDVSTPSVVVRLPADVDLHARPAAEFVRTALGFSSQLWLATDVREVDAKSLLSILALGAKAGSELRLRARGEDAAVALQTLANTLGALRE